MPFCHFLGGDCPVAGLLQRGSTLNSRKLSGSKHCSRTGSRNSKPALPEWRARPKRPRPKRPHLSRNLQPDWMPSNGKSRTSGCSRVVGRWIHFIRLPKSRREQPRRSAIGTCALIPPETGIRPSGSTMERPAWRKLRHNSMLPANLRSTTKETCIVPTGVTSFGEFLPATSNQTERLRARPFNRNEVRQHRT